MIDPNNHTRKVPFCCNRIQEGGMEICGTWIPDDIVFSICSFLCRRDLSDSYPGSKQDLQLSHLYQKFSHTSKAFGALIRRYIHTVPLNLRFSGRNDQTYQNIGWICEKEINLKHCDIYVRDENEATLWTNILLMRSFAHLESCNLHLILQQESDGIGSKMYFYEIDEPSNRNGNRLEQEKKCKEFRHKFAEIVPKRAIFLKRMTLTLKGEFCIELIRAFSKTLEELELIIFRPDRFCQSSDSSLMSELHALGQVIEASPRLKKFKIKAMFKASLTIRSKTLEIIDTTGSRGVFVDTCECASLQIFSCDHKRNYEKDWSNGVNLPSELFANDDISSRDNILRIFSGSRLAGFRVPRNCTLRIQT